MTRNRTFSQLLKRLWLVLVVSILASAPVLAEPANNKKEDAAPKFPAAPSAKKGEPQSQPVTLPDEYKINMLIRGTIIAVSQANKTGNYTVLRDLGSPKFRKSNSAERLASIFEDQRKSKFDFSPILFFTPKLLRPAALTEDGMLRMTGFFDTRPQRVAFDLLFENVKGDWQLYGINIATHAAPQSGDAAAPAGP